MPDEEGTSHLGIKKEKPSPMPKSVKDHVHLAKGAGDQLHSVHQGDGVSGVCAGHPTTYGFQSGHHQSHFGFED